MAEFACFAILTVFVFGNLFFSLWLSKHTGAALVAAQGAMKALENRQDALCSLVLLSSRGMRSKSRREQP